MPALYRVTIPVRTQSESNLREHWRSKASRTAAHRQAARLCVQSALNVLPPWNELRQAIQGRHKHITIRLTRVAPRTLDPGNLEGSFKACQDGIADALGIDDGSQRLTWCYTQRRGAAREYAVLVEMTC
ncbi:MAG: hypothetical protein NTW87_00750 [Planctomycetota bacterium]|nr:hypothetical protein [Planctomycetota bacterium]